MELVMALVLAFLFVILNAQAQQTTAEGGQTVVAKNTAGNDLKKGKEIPIEKMSSAARQALLRQIGGGRVAQVWETNLNGQTVYQASFQRDSANSLLVLGQDGKLLSLSVAGT